MPASTSSSWSSESSSTSSSSTSISSLSLLIGTFWFDHYNTPNSWLPLILPTILWSSCWCYARLYQHWDFARWYKLHTIHHVGAIFIASCSLYFDTNDIVNERIGILWSLPYFIIDIVDCIYMQHLLYIAHGLACAILGLCNYNIPLLQVLRMNSKASYIEASSILLYQVKQHRQPWLFVIFATMYTACRIIWIPIMGKQLLDHGMKWYDIIFLLLVAFYGLQVHWWIKIIQILFKGSDGDERKSDKDSDSDSMTTKKKETNKVKDVKEE